MNQKQKNKNPPTPLLRLTTAMLSAVLLMNVVYAIPGVVAIPSCVAHPHTAATVHWEIHGDVSHAPDHAHNHEDAHDFDNDHTEIYIAYGVWDCRALRVEDVFQFDEGHGYIDENDATKIPRYSFHDENGATAGDGWPEVDAVTGLDPKSNIEKAFKEWGDLQTAKLNHHTGLQFNKAASGGEIIVHWHNIGGLGVTTYTAGDPGSMSVTFDTNPSSPWFFGASAATPANNFHFYSTALHEIGHVVGLHEQTNKGDVMRYERKEGCIGLETGPCFDSITANAKHGAIDLYTIELETECSNGVDDDGDGLTDYPDDPGCLSSHDDSEQDSIGGGTTVGGFIVDAELHSESGSTTPFYAMFLLMVGLFIVRIRGESR